MGKYLLKRLLIFIPTLFAVTLCSFLITINSPRDTVERLISTENGGDFSVDDNFHDKAYLEKRQELGLDLPVFYVSIGSLAEPDTLSRIPRPDDQAALSRWVAEYGNWKEISLYYQQLHALNDLGRSIKVSSEYEDALSNFRGTVVLLRSTGSLTEMSALQAACDSLSALLPDELGALKTEWAKSRTAWEHVVSTATPWKNYIPCFRWNGPDCQYHKWLAALLRFDMGVSFKDSKKVSTHILESVRWSIFLSLFSTLLAYFLSIYTGTWSAVRHNTPGERRLSVLLFILYSLPGFWVATLLIQFLATPDYLKLFPAGGVMSDGSTEWSLAGRWLDFAWHMVLPTICYVYGSFVMLSRQLRASMLDALNTDYVRTARAKGLPLKTVVWRHAFRNSLIPLITSFAHVFPAIISGSIVMEQIFSIPGIGRENLNAIGTGDYPVIIGVFTISAVLSLLGILVSDVLYAVADPRISFSKR